MAASWRKLGTTMARSAQRRQDSGASAASLPPTSSLRQVRVSQDQKKEGGRRTVKERRVDSATARMGESRRIVGTPFVGVTGLSLKTGAQNHSDRCRIGMGGTRKRRGRSPLCRRCSRIHPLPGPGWRADRSAW